MGKEKTIKGVYLKLKGELKKRGCDFKREEFDREVLQLLDDRFFNAILEKHSPTDFLIKEKMAQSPDFRSRVLELYKEAGVI